MNATIANQETAYHSNITIASDGKVIRRKSTLSLLLSLVILAAGVVLLIVASGMAEKTGVSYTASLVFGIIAVGAGLGMLFFGNKQWVYMPTKSKITVHSKFIDPSQFDAVCQAIYMRDPSLLGKGLQTVERSGVRIDMYVSADGEFAAAQTFRYVPYTYSAVTPVCCAYGEQARELSRLL